MTSEMKALIERPGFIVIANDFMFKLKVGVAVISSYWNMSMGRGIGEVP
ncbi:MAG: hypothetical protein J5U19_11395 [Candidatus Methanoperedens sp.]|nr:hypothetical protein [Candidatus Methanoperedens sp.]